MISKNLITKIGRRGRCTTRRKDSRRVVELPRDFRRPRCCCCCCSFSFVAAVLHLLLLRLDCATKFGGVFGNGAKKQRENFFILLSAEKKSVLSSRKRSRRPSFISRRKIKLNMTARITYKRRYVLDALGFFLFIFARRGKRWMRRERVSERSSFARVRVIYVYADEDILSAFFSLLFCERRRTLREILRAAKEEETRRWNGLTRA